jgi:hypothetical protein
MSNRLKALAFVITLVGTYLALFHITLLVYSRWKYTSMNYMIYGLYYRTPAQDFITQNEVSLQLIWHLLNFVVMILASWVFFKERILGGILIAGYMVGQIPFIDFSGLFI